MSDFVKVLEDELAALELAMANGTIKAKRLRELLTAEYRAMSTGEEPAKDVSVQDDIVPSVAVSTAPTVSAQAAKDVLAKLAHSSRSAVQNTHTMQKPAPVARDGKGAHMKHEIAQLISERGAPVHRTAILKHLTRKKMIGNKPNQLAYISSYLSRWSRDFVSDGHGNFSLRNGRLSGPPRAPSERHSIGAAG